MELKSYTYSKPVFAFWNIVSPTDLETYNLQKDPKQDPNIINFAGDNWYDWNVRNWGTKWDVAVGDNEEYPETEITFEDDSAVGYRFNTAWGAPLQAIENLSSQYPELEFELDFEEETGWGGEYIFIDGNGSELSSYESKCRDCDSTDCMEYCDNDCGEICSECHYLGEADLEAVAECDEHKEFLNEDHVPNYRLEKAE
jgi:hypothetical protein